MEVSGLSVLPVNSDPSDLQAAWICKHVDYKYNILCLDCQILGHCCQNSGYTRNDGYEFYRYEKYYRETVG